MKICVSAAGNSLDAPLYQSFGRCPYFVVVDPETMQFEAVSNDASEARGAGIRAVRIVASKGVKVVITGEVGPNAFQALSKAGIEVFTGAHGTVREVVEKYKRGELKKVDAPSAGKFGISGRGNGWRREREQQGGGKLRERIVIPVEDGSGLNARLAEHFGRAPYFVIVELESGNISNVQVVPNEGEHFGGIGHASDLVMRFKPNAVIACSIGPKALSAFRKAGIAVLRAKADTVKDVIEAYRLDKLEELTEASQCHHR